MRALVTGCSGFIASHLIRGLRLNGWDVLGVDIRSYKGSDLSLFLQDDICSPKTWRRELPQVDAVFHLAAVSSVVEAEEKTSFSFQSNVMGTVEVLNWIASQKVRPKLLFTSTCAVYGHAGKENEGIAESQTLPEPLSVYALQKLQSEQIIKHFVKSKGIQGLNLRLFNVYGPGQDPNSAYAGVISRFIRDALEGKPLTIHGDGRQSRDFVFVSDVVNALLKAATAPEDVFDGKVINVGTGRSISINDLAFLISSSVKRDVTTRSCEARAGDVRHSLCNPNLASDQLGWTSRVSFAEGLIQTIEHMRSLHSGTSSHLSLQ